MQRTSSDLRLNPHLHLVVLDGAWHEDGGELTWEGVGHLGTSEVGEVLERGRPLVGGPAGSVGFCEDPERTAGLASP